MLEFKRISKEDKEELLEYTKKADTRNCEFSIGNIYLWNNCENLKYCIFEDILLYRLVSGKDAIYSPVGLPKDIDGFMKAIEKDARANGENLILNNLSEDMIRIIEHRYVGEYSFGFDRDDSDYIYKVSDLINLSGAKYHGKKNHLNKFFKNFDFVYEEITPENIPECREMKNCWAAQKQEESGDSFEEELEILDEAFDSYEELRFTGGLIRIDNRVAAFTFGEAVNGDTFVTHFEKAYENIPGLYQAINQQFAQNALKDYIYVNREDDMGIEGIRRAKLSYRPVMMWDKYWAKKVLI